MPNKYVPSAEKKSKVTVGFQASFQTQWLLFCRIRQMEEGHAFKLGRRDERMVAAERGQCRSGDSGSTLSHWKLATACGLGGMLGW